MAIRASTFNASIATKFKAVRFTDLGLLATRQSSESIAIFAPGRATLVQNCLYQDSLVTLNRILA